MGVPNSSDHSPAIIIFVFQVKSHSAATSNDQSLSSIPSAELIRGTSWEGKTTPKK